MQGRKFVAISLAVVHALGCGQLGYLISDALLARTKIVSEYFPCADHGCGCETVEDCRNQCCCYPAQVLARATSSVPASDSGTPACFPAKGFVKTVPISALESAKCSGTIPDDGLPGSVKLQIPPSAPFTAAIPRVESQPKPPNLRLGRRPAGEAPDPVPKLLS